MRKTLIVFLALALVCACGAAVCTHAVAAPREDVTFDEHVFAGDPAAAAGLQVQLQAALRQNLFWDSTVRFSGRDYTADTAFRFSPVAVSREQPRQYSGVEVDTRVNVWTDSDTNPFGYRKAYQEILDTLEPGQTGTKVVYIPMWMQDYSVVYYDAHLNRTVESGGDLTEEEINSREDIFPEEMYTIAAEPNTKVEYDLHGFIQNIYYRGGDGAYYLDPATAAAMQP